MECCSGITEYLKKDDGVSPPVPHGGARRDTPSCEGVSRTVHPYIEEWLNRLKSSTSTEPKSVF